MTKDYDDSMSGVLFKNDRKEKPTHPDLTGKIKYNGTEHYLSAWSKVSERTGAKFLSLEIGKEVVSKAEQPAETTDDDNDIW